MTSTEKLAKKGRLKEKFKQTAKALQNAERAIEVQIAH